MVVREAVDAVAVAARAKVVAEVELAKVVAEADEAKGAASSAAAAAVAAARKAVRLAAGVEVKWVTAASVEADTRTRRSEHRPWQPESN